MIDCEYGKKNKKDSITGMKEVEMCPSDLCIRPTETCGLTRIDTKSSVCASWLFSMINTDHIDASILSHHFVIPWSPSAWLAVVPNK
jgi:hypothetical protein